MSYNGTVHCRHCYGKGHNRRTCPQLTDQYKRRAVNELNNGEGREGYWHGEYAKRTGYWLDPDTQENGEKATELKKSRASGTRRCKYCAKTGHNTRTCPELKEAKATAIRETREYREAALAVLVERGIGIGALVQTRRYDSTLAYMVKGINWNAMTHRSGNNNSSIINLEILNPSLVSGWQRNNQIPVPPVNAESTNWDAYEVIGPVPGAAVPLTIPDGWLEDTSWLEGMFEGAQSPNWHENRYDY